MTAADKIRQQIRNLPQGTIQNIDDMNLRMFGFVLIDVAGALLEGLAIAVESKEGGCRY